jgi:hypothetical protein
MHISDNLKQNLFHFDNTDTNADISTEENLEYHSLNMSCVEDDQCFGTHCPERWLLQCA